jgi:hypothetical protein
MGNMDNIADDTATWRSSRHRLRLECRECEVVCERVVYPWHCLKSQCEGIYAYEDGDTTYFGCLYKVFAAEFDLAVFSEDPELLETLKSRSQSGDVPAGRGAGRRRRVGQRSLKASDPYGPIRVVRLPRPQCMVKVEQAYEALSSACTCCNPTFFHHPYGQPEDEIRLTFMPSADDPGPRR